MSRLVVLTGLPRSGKSSIAEVLAHEHSFVRVSSDGFRRSYFGSDSIRYYDTPDAERKEQLINAAMKNGVYVGVKLGFDVVVDATASTSKHRAEYLDPYPEDPLFAERFLIWLQTDRAVVEERARVCGRNTHDLARWDKFWEDPQEDPKYTLLRYSSNTPQDLVSAMDDISMRLGL